MRPIELPDDHFDNIEAKYNIRERVKAKILKIYIEAYYEVNNLFFLFDPLANFMVGARAGCTTLAIIYPLDIAHTRLAADDGRKESFLYTIQFHKRGLSSPLLSVDSKAMI